MKGTPAKCLLIFLIGLFPAVLFAADSIFSPSPGDKSVQYLSMIFGNVGSLIKLADDTGASQFSQLIYIFNQVVFSLGIIIISYTALAGVIGTAQEGEVMGKKWSSIIIPLRAGIGVYLLIPSGVTNYNWIQIIVMWFILQGIGAADALWKQVIINNQTEGGVHSTKDTLEVTLKDGMSTIDSIFRSSVCMVTLNRLAIDKAYVGTIITQPLAPFRFGDKIYFGRPGTTEEPLCGFVTIPDLGQSVFAQSSTSETEARKNAIAAAIIQTQAALAPAAEDAVTNLPADWTAFDSFLNAKSVLKGLATQLATTFSKMDNVYEKAIDYGWIHAGSYYFQLVSASAGKTLNLPAGGINKEAIKKVIGTLGTDEISEMNTKIGDYITFVINNVSGGTATRPPSEMAFTPSKANKGEIQGVLDAIFGTFFIDLATDIGKMITTNQGDPIVSMANFGGNMAATIELIFWGALIVVFFAWLATSICSCIQPLGHAMDFILAIMIPIVTLIISLLWAAGITLALYVPLIPFIIFTFGAIAWIILVIEAMLGAPLIALTLIVPSEDEIGKAGHAIIILLGLFLRPALMILGFIFATKFLLVAVGMLNFAFGTTLKQSISMGFGLFGWIAVLILYVGLAVGLVHEAFSLVYVLPDKVLRWMGGSPEDTGKIAQKTKQMEGSVDKGAGMGKGMMKGVMSKVSKKK